MKKGIKITLMVIGVIVVLFIIVFFIVSLTSKKLKCTSKEGNITLMYNDKTITGYTAKNMSYDLDEQKEYAELIGIDEYLEEFTTWFEKNTSGTCK